MKLVVAPEKYTQKKNDIKVFLAGGITNCPDWQSKIISYFKKLDFSRFGREYEVVLFNPRRKNFPINDPKASEEQIKWEFENLRSAEVICFWFSEGSLNPIVLYELGYWGNSRPESCGSHDFASVIGCSPKYERKNDVIVQTKLAKADKRVHTSFVSFIKDLEGTITHRIAAREIQRGIDAKFNAFGGGC